MVEPPPHRRVDGMSDARNIHQSLGEIRGILSGLSQSLRDSREDQKRQEERLSGEIVRFQEKVAVDIMRLRDERRERDTEVTAQLQLLNKLVGDAVTDASEVNDKVGKLEPKVESLIELRNKGVAYIVVLMSVISVVMWFIGPPLRDYISHTVAGGK